MSFGTNVLSGVIGVPIVKVVTHYAVEDEDFSGDYLSIDLLIGGGKVRSYSGSGGREKIQGWLDALSFVWGSKVQPVEEQINDA